MNKTTVVGAVAFLLLFTPPAARADEPVALTPVTELPDRPDMEALAEELRALAPAERRERLSDLREKYGAREERRTHARQPARTNPHALLKRSFPDRAAHTNALAGARNPAARELDPVTLLKLQQQQLTARLRQYESLGTNAPVALETKIKQLEELNRRIDERLKVLDARDERREDGAKAEETDEAKTRSGEATRSKEPVSRDEEKSEK